MKSPRPRPPVQIDPWGSNQVQDYARLRDEFGIEPFGAEEWGVFSSPHRLFRRGVVFGHRDFQRIEDAIRGHDPWAVMTGLMPSGDMHLGHKMVMDQVVAHQAQGADIHIAIADYEAVAARGLTLEKARALALDQYVLNYLALGLDPGRAEVYFQTQRRRVRDLADRFAQKVNLSQLQALYGFGGETSLAHINAPLVQAADILHVQREELGGPRPVLVPVGVDQDPHIRFTRDIASRFRRFNIAGSTITNQGGEGQKTLVQDEVGLFVRGKEDPGRWLDIADDVLGKAGISVADQRRKQPDYRVLWTGMKPDSVFVDSDGKARLRRLGRDMDLVLARAEQERGEFGFIQPSATFHRFITGLDGGKMSSSRPDSSIFLTEDPGVAEKKLMRSITGGRATAEEQRREGADPSKCPVYELYLYHLADDARLETVYSECTGGERLCGGCKREAAGLLVEFLASHKERRDEVAHLVGEIVADD